MDAPPQLRLSALSWIGHPTTFCREDWDEFVGKYVPSADVLLKKGRMNVEHGAIEYIPSTATSFKYTRHAFTGTASSEVTYNGAVYAEEMSPVIRICLPDRRPWPEKFKADEDIERALTGPPFKFYALDWEGEHGIHPERISGVHIDAPDLPGQDAEDVGGDFTEGREADSQEGLGWRGAWVTELLWRQGRRQRPLGERTKVIWNANGDDRGWGVQVRLDALQVVEYDASDEHDEDEGNADDTSPTGISDYTIRATILRVFVKSEEFSRLQEPEEEEEDLQEEDGGSEFGRESEFGDHY